MLKTTVLLEKLKEGATLTHHAVSARNPLPILLNFLLVAKDGGLTISATDLEIGIQVNIPAKVEKEGSVTVPAKTFVDLISSTDQEKIELEEQNGTLILKANKLKTEFPTLPAEEFPKLYGEKGEKQASIKKEIFEKEAPRVVFSAATDTGRPALSGVLIKTEEKGISMVATDGYRLSLKKGMAVKKTNKTAPKNVLIPARTIKELTGVKNEAEEISLYIEPTSNQALLETGEVTIVGRLIEAEYPDYEKIIPSDFTTSVQFDKNEALSAVRSCSVFAREAANIIKMTIGKNNIVFSASASSVGQNETEIEAKVEGEENEIAFNARYLLDFLGSVDEEAIRFEMTGPLNPGVFKVAGDESFLHLIMPIRVQG